MNSKRSTIGGLRTQTSITEAPRPAGKPTGAGSTSFTVLRMKLTLPHPGAPTKDGLMKEAALLELFRGNDGVTGTLKDLETTSSWNSWILRLRMSTVWR